MDRVDRRGVLHTNNEKPHLHLLQLNTHLHTQLNYKQNFTLTPDQFFLMKLKHISGKSRQAFIAAKVKYIIKKLLLLFLSWLG